MNNYRQLVDELSCRHTLCDADMRKLISNADNYDVSYLMEKAREAGCNVVMPDLSPEHAKEKYMLYNNKAGSGSEAAAGLSILKKSVESIGYNIVTGRGDCKRQVN